MLYKGHFMKEIYLGSGRHPMISTIPDVVDYKLKASIDKLRSIKIKQPTE